MFVCQIIALETLDRLALIGELVRPTESLLDWFCDIKLSGSTLIAKIQISVKIVQVRVNGSSYF